MDADKKRAVPSLVLIILIVGAMISTLVAMSVMMWSSAKWGLSEAWALYLVTSLVLAWVVVDVRASVDIRRDRRESVPSGDTSQGAPDVHIHD